MASRLLRTLRFKRVIGLMSLQTATELVTLFLVLNKFTGVYGLLAILTGYKLSALQLLTYIYSIGVLGLIVYLLPHIRRQTPLECLALAWVYGIDTLVNIACTVAFGAYWFTGGDTGSVPRVPESDSPNEVTSPRIGPADTIASLVLIVTFTLLRVYLSLVVASYAQHVLQLASEPDHSEEQRGDARLFPSPFAAGSTDGDGWRGKLGQTLVSVGRNYWLQKLDDDAWTQDVQARFRMTSGPSGTAGDIG